MTRQEELKRENLLLLMSEDDIKELDVYFDSINTKQEKIEVVVELGPTKSNDSFEDALDSLDLSFENADFL